MIDRHTPTPWENDGEVIIAPHKNYASIASTIDDPQIDEQKQKTNFAFIVQAVNCHDELVEALDMAIRALRDNDIDTSMAGEFEILTDALAKAS